MRKTATAVLLATTSLLATDAGAAPVTWIAGLGQWSNAGFWLPAGLPAAGDDVIVNDPNLTQFIEVSPGVGFSGNPSLASVFIGANTGGLAADEIHVTNGRTFTLTGGGLVNNGIFSLNSGGALTDLALVGAQTFNASAAGVIGELRMSDHANNRITTNNTVLTNGANHRISGAGQILANTGGMINEGQIIANATNTLVIDPNALGVTNSGVMSGASAAGLVLRAGTFTNFIGSDAGEINAASGGKVLIESATVNGGIVTTVGNGFIDVRASTFNGVSFQDNVTGNGTVEQFNGQNVSITNGLDLQNVTWKLNSSGALTDLLFVGSQTISGNGTILMGDHGNNRIVNNNVITTIGANTTIRGAGQLGANSGGFDNQGTILAEGTNALVIDVNGLGFANNGIVNAQGSGGLHITGATIVANNTAIDVDTGSALLIDGASRINGGLINLGAGVAADLRGTTLDAVTINGDVFTANAINNTILNGLTLNGTWTLNSNAALTDLVFTGAQTIGGNATIVMGDHQNNRIVNNNVITTIGANTTIRGAGQLGANTGGFDNQGTILAEGANALVIDTNTPGFANNGILHAQGSGGLHITGATVVANNTAIDVDTGSALLIDGTSRINGGSINLGAGVAADLRSTTLDAVTINGDVLTVNAINNTILNGLTLNGTWTLNSNAALTDLVFTGAQTISGNATIVMGDHQNNRIVNNNVITTIGASTTIRGAGQLGANTGGFDNQGAILAEGNNALVIDTNTLGFANNGILHAQGNGGLHITGATVVANNTAIDVDTGSALLIDGTSRINGGLINIGAGVAADLRSTTLDTVTINGDVLTVNAINNTILNGLTLNGTWTLNSVAALTDLRFNGAQTIGGNATIMMGDHQNNRIVNNNVITTIGANTTIRGAGQLGANSGGFDNQGTILAEGANALVIDVNGLGFANNGILHAQGNGGLHITGATVVANNTAIDVDTGSALLIDGTSRINGGLINLGAGVAADLRSTTLDAVTINGDVFTANAINNTVLNGLTLNGTWTLNSVAALTDLRFNGAQTIGGNATIVMGDHQNNRIVNNNVITTIGANTTIRGAGQLGANTGGFVNDGTLIAEGAVSALVIDVNARGFENRGHVIVDGTAGLTSVDDFRQSAGETTVDSEMRLNPGRLLRLEGGELNGSGTIIGDVNNSGGNVNAGNSPGTLAIDGDYTQTTGGTVLVEIAGSAPGQFDVLTVTGSASLAGTIVVDLLGAPTFAVGQSFDVLIAASISNSFANSSIDAGFATFDVLIVNGLSEDIVRLTATSVSAVPLPAAAWLFAAALVTLGATRRSTTAAA